MDDNNKIDTKNKKRTIRYTVRFSPDDEHKLILRNSEACGLKVSVYLRVTGLQQAVRARLTDEEKIIYHQLTGMANNINQLAKAAHIGGALS